MPVSRYRFSSYLDGCSFDLKATHWHLGYTSFFVNVVSKNYCSCGSDLVWDDFMKDDTNLAGFLEAIQGALAYSIPPPNSPRTAWG